MRAIAAGSSCAISSPAKRTLPRVAGAKPESTLKNVVLPAPLGPMIAWTFPRHVERDAVERGEARVDLDDVARREDRFGHGRDFHHDAKPAPHDHETILEVEAPRVKFGRGAIDEAGAEAAALGLRRVALFTDPPAGAARSSSSARARSLRAAGVDVAEFDEVRIEPTDASFREAAAFAREARADGYVSVGGGSAIDTAKAANLYATYPAPFERYVNAPLGEGAPVPGPLAPHIACPTTSGTGSECTGIAIFDFVAHDVKTGIASRRLRPTLGIVDPDATRTLPATVVASSGFDVLAHALESFTASRTRAAAPGDAAGAPALARREPV